MPSPCRSISVFFVLLALISSVIVVSFGEVNASPATVRIAPPPPGKTYHGVYPGERTGEEDDVTLADLQSYERTVGKTAAWVYFSNNWYRNRRFPLATAIWIHSTGSVPFIRLMLRDSPDQYQNHYFTLSRIIRGDFDADLKAWARAARNFGSPLLVEYGTEVNGYWFPWNGQWNGGPAGPARFRDAYRHIIQVMRQEGTSNIMWVFHVNTNDLPNVSWNRFENYYPGDTYIDWVGLSAYGAQTPMDAWCDSFRDMLDSSYPRLIRMSPTKPVIVLEFGVTSGNPLCDQTTWARKALVDLINFRWGHIIGFSWWNEKWENDDNPAHNTDMRVQDNPGLGKVFRGLVGTNNNVLGRVIFVRNQPLALATLVKPE
jgi:hypothetical protein